MMGASKPVRDNFEISTVNANEITKRASCNGVRMAGTSPKSAKMITATG